MERKGLRKGIILMVAGILMILADQLTKWVIVNSVPYGYATTVIPDFFDISHVRNSGAAWGVFQGYTWLLSVITLIACALIVYLLVVSVHSWLSASLIMVLSGAIGNLIDRILRGRVVDFLSFHFGSYDFPSFNVADICITCGCILLVIVILFMAKDGNTLFQEGSIARKWFGTEEKKITQETECEDASRQ